MLDGVSCETKATFEVSLVLADVLSQLRIVCPGFSKLGSQVELVQAHYEQEQIRLCVNCWRLSRLEPISLVPNGRLPDVDVALYCEADTA